MSIYKRIIISVICIFIVSISLIGIIQYRTISKYYSLYLPAKVRNALLGVQDHFRKEINGGMHNKQSYREIQNISEAINRSLLTIEELDILKEEIALYVIVSTTVIPVILLLFGIGATIYLIRNLFKPITALTIAMNEYSKGKSSRFPLMVIGSPESRLLIQTTNEMIGTINRQKDIISLQGKFLGWRDSAREIMHELKNILTPARLAAETGYEHACETNNQAMKKNIGTVLESFTIIERMTRALKDVSNMRTPEPSDINLIELARKSVEFYTEKFPSILLQGEPLTVYADENLIRSALDNCIVNSIEALARQPDGAIVVRVGQNQYPYLECSDNGPGIPDDMRYNIFKMHFTTKPGGSGFGLYFVKKVMTDHGYSVVLGPGIDSKGITIRMVFHGDNSDR